MSTSAHAALKAPPLQSPAASASVEALPSFTWKSVKGAKEYEFQLSDDPKFNSIVLGRGKGKGSQKTRNTAATLDKSVPDGNYFWRVRAIDSKSRVGRWTKGRSFTKAWTTPPTLTAPADEFAVSWPNAPLMLRWEPVKYATRYIVTIATDPTFAQLVGTPQNKPAEVPGTAFALQGTLPVGRYFWAITPIDSGGLRGTRSRVGSFTWTWQTATGTSLLDLNASERVFDPLMSWDLVPGAARYEVEINPDDDFAAGSRVCCKDPVIGTSLSPTRILPNNNDFAGSSGYHWRVRAFDIDGNPGQWNRGPTFQKAYDAVTPSVPGLHLRDHNGPLPPSTATVLNGATIQWDPVPGAALYHVQWSNYASGACNWSNASSPIKTAATAWSSLSPTHEGGVPGGVGITASLLPNGNTARSGHPFTPENAFPGVAGFANGVSYCIRVRALSDDSFRENDNAVSPVVSAWTQVGGDQNQPAFTFQKPADDTGAALPANPPAYIGPAGEAVTRTPVLSWHPVAGARRYYVFIARDSNFTNVIDAAFTANTTYAPNWALEDEATQYFWAVVPTASPTGAGVSGGPAEYAPRSFNKLSLPAAPIQPVGGADVTTQPTFRWTPAESAQKYRLQVSADPQFGDLLDDVVTSSTAYTSSTPYPADTVLYWRVRAEQLQALRNTVRVELRWSELGSFRRRLPSPVFSPDIPLRGELPPPLLWSAVPGAVSYDFQLDEADGDSNVFNVKSPAGTFSKLTGIGTFKFRVRANFATRSGVVASAYSPQRDFTRLISPPAAPRATRSGTTRLVLGWSPAAAAASYRVEVSTSESFSKLVDSTRTNNTSWAPTLEAADYRKRGAPLYWRVASVDEGNNVGSFVSNAIVKGKPLSVRVLGSLRRNRTSRLSVVVRGAGRAQRLASVRATGAGVRPQTKRTNKRGSAVMTLRPTKKGFVSIRVARSGFTTKTVKVRVR
ncbi:MAG: hypothetical protein AVDCRST_MAG67-4534 [uncultured Solirubrobacteraceae bacterium]|uniref:Fibronectin type-III domain-containing protein n=1 Tax=uncultured Solirubrobacteraceae bacterium TaxID=1162706 RepID=A0A6J4TXS0_9ACTN|nr:MAG: hypothetical protein AVDCRST_MAG67-4534 [uncultured Solirubrobacteraceae bacterium]